MHSFSTRVHEQKSFVYAKSTTSAIARWRVNNELRSGSRSAARAGLCRWELGSCYTLKTRPGLSLDGNVLVSSVAILHYGCTVRRPVCTAAAGRREQHTSAVSSLLPPRVMFLCELVARRANSPVFSPSEPRSAIALLFVGASTGWYRGHWWLSVVASLSR